MGAAIVLLAAGTSRRFGSLKQLASLEGRSLLRRVADTALATALPVGVVTGAGSDGVLEELAGLPVRVVHNPDWAGGMGGSLSRGVRAAMDAGASAVMVMLADQPLVEVADLHAILREHAADATAIVAADHGGNGVLGPPCLFPASDFPALIALDGDRGAKALLGQHADRLRVVPMPNAALDVDTPGELAKAADRLRKT